MNSTPPTPRLLLSASEAAEALGVCLKSLWSRTQPRGSIPVVRFGTRVLYDPVDLRRWIDLKKGGDGDNAY